MKYALLQILVLIALAAAVYAAGQAFTEQRWGEPGTSSLKAALAICLAAAIIAAGTLGTVATYLPEYAPQAAFGGTAIRLLITGALAIAYQTFIEVHLSSFLFWLLSIYLVFLVVETALGIWLVLRTLKQKPQSNGE